MHGTIPAIFVAISLLLAGCVDGRAPDPSDPSLADDDTPPPTGESQGAGTANSTQQTGAPAIRTIRAAYDATLYPPYVDVTCPAPALTHSGGSIIANFTGIGTAADYKRIASIEVKARMEWTSNHPTNENLTILIEDETGADRFEPSGASPLEFQFVIDPEADNSGWAFSPYFWRLLDHPAVGDEYIPNLANVTVALHFETTYTGAYEPSLTTELRGCM